MKKIILLLSCLLGLAGCQKGRSFFPKQLQPQSVTILRFDSALLAVTDSTVHEDVARLYDSYELFMPVWMESILGIHADDTAYLCEVLPKFLSDTTYGFSVTNAEVKRQFADISALQTSLNKAFARILFLYPDWSVPTVYFFISGFNSSLLFVDDDLAIGTDMYLGSDWVYYNRVVYDYQKQTMRRECIPTDLVSAYLFRNIPYTYAKSRLLDQMMYRGKVMYLLAQIFDDQSPWETMGYTEEQWRWCVTNERAIWNHIMDRRDLFKTEPMVLTSYLNDGPFTSEVSQDAPGRLGTWIGWRITESYMNHHEEVSLQELMLHGNAQQLLEESYYRP